GDISDNYGGVGWKIYVWHNGELVIDEVDYERNMAWNLSNAPAGTYEIQVEAEDHADHIVAEKITITVSDDEPATTGNSPDTDTDADTDTDGTGATDTNGSGTAGPTAGEVTGGTDSDSDTGIDVDEGGCNCQATSDQGPPATALLAFAGVLGLRRRRRRT
ncbi:MAG: MYXO-CTERM sorting domain-containing protein, partial [Nannocystaceae bacterium]